MDEVRLTRHGGEIRLTGPLTLKTVAGVAREAQALLDAPEPELALDLSGLTRLDSAGLALLVAWTKTCREADSRLRLVAMPRFVEPLIELYQLQEVFPQSPQEPE